MEQMQTETERPNGSFKAKGENRMDQTEIGKFIAKCRKEKQLTQAQLAEKLNITDRAVSKWETGKSMPDASIMLDLCAVLGITANELLSAEKIGAEGYEKKAEENLLALKRKDENARRKNGIFSVLFSLTLLLGSVVCLICDIALSGTLTWSLIPVSSIVFAWAIFFPSIIGGKRGIAVSLLSLSIFIVPYLFVLSRLLKVKEVFSVGAAVAAASVAFLWLIAAVFVRMGKAGRLMALGVICLLSVPFRMLINFILSKMLKEPMFDAWDMLSGFVLLTAAFVCFACDYVKKQKSTRS